MGLELHHGDCFDVMPALAPRSVDMVLADHPYGTTRCAWDSHLPLKDLWAEYGRLCSGPIVLFAQTPFDKALGASNLCDLRYEWIWEKSHPTGHLNAKRAPMKAHENILVFCRGAVLYNPIKTGGHVRKTATKRRDQTPVYGAQDFAPIPYDSTERYPRSVLKFPSDKQRSNLHPTQKPVALCEYLIRTYTDPGATVLDNCMGSGTTGIACINTGRNFVGIEKNAAYFATAKTRITNTANQRDAA